MPPPRFDLMERQRQRSRFLRPHTLLMVAATKAVVQLHLAVIKIGNKIDASKIKLDRMERRRPGGRGG